MPEPRVSVELRAEDLQHAEEAWQLYKKTMAHHPRRQLRKRELIAGFLSGVLRERMHQQLNVHPNLVRIQSLIDLAELQPEAFAELRRRNPESFEKIRAWLAVSS